MNALELTVVIMRFHFHTISAYVLMDYICPVTHRSERKGEKEGGGGAGWERGEGDVAGDGMTVVITRFPFPDHQCLCPHGRHLPCDSQVREEDGERRVGGGEGGKEGWNRWFTLDHGYQSFFTSRSSVPVFSWTTSSLSLTGKG